MMVNGKQYILNKVLKYKRITFEAGFSGKINSLLDIVGINPFEEYPPFEKLIGDLKGAYSRRINHKHRFVYQVYKDEHAIKVISMWTHYE